MICSLGKVMLAVSAGLPLALSAESAIAALIIEPFPSDLTTTFTSCSLTTESTMFSGPHPARSRDDEDKNVRRALEIELGLASLPATTGHCNSSPQSSGGQLNGDVLSDALWKLPPIGPWTCLPAEARIILPARVPFDLLRPV